MTINCTAVSLWMLDSSTFINFSVIDRIALFVLLRSPLYFSEYVYRFELGIKAHESTRSAARQSVARKQIGVRSLSLSDLERISQLGAPRRIGLGEIACAIIAERETGGVLCDDWKGKRWLTQRMVLNSWESTEDVLLEAARLGHISEFDLDGFQARLEEERYVCRFNLRLEHLRRVRNQ